MRKALLGSTLVLAAGCGGPPDLLPEKPHPDITDDPVAYCELDAAGRLRVIVGNDGGREATAEVIVMFPHARSRVVDTVTVAPGRTQDVFAPVPAPVPAGSFRFWIIVDSAAVVMESDETNNVAEGYCLT